MASKPTKVPDWNTGLTNNAEPNGAKKILGWVANESPASSFFNWVLNLSGQWAAYLRDGVFTGEAAASGLDATGGTGNTLGVKGTGIGTGAGVKGIGGATNGAGVEGAGTGSGSGVKGTGATGFGVEGTGGTGVGIAGAGVKGTGGSTNGSGVVGIGGATNGVGIVGSGAGTGDGVQGQGGATNASGVTGFGGGTSGAGVNGIGTTNGESFHASGNVVALKCTGGNPAAATALTNQATAASFCKAWGRFLTDGGGGVTLVDGMNVSGVSINAGNVRVDLASAFSSVSTYAVMWQPSVGNQCPFWQVVDADTFDLEATKRVDGSAVDFGATSAAGTFFVFGKQ